MNKKEKEFIEGWINYFRPYDRKRYEHEFIELIKSRVKDDYKSCHYDPSEDMTDWENDPENFAAKESSERKK